MSKKIKGSDCLTITVVEVLYRLRVKTVVTDGKYVQIEPEEIKKEMAKATISKNSQFHYSTTVII